MSEINHPERKKRDQSHPSQPFLYCAELILPYLIPSELASISSTCRILNCISRTINLHRSSNASRNFENHPIPFINPVDRRPYDFFVYTPSQIIATSSNSREIRRQSWGSLHSGENPSLPSPLGLLSCQAEYGCNCENCDGGFECPCSRLRTTEVISECGYGCSCSSECGNRITQRGVSVLLKIVRDRRKGWGLHAAESIRQGQFVCEYAGELLTTEEARRRQSKYDKLSSDHRFSSALLVVREHLPSGEACLRLNIDATEVGNVARFINHSCDGGNLSTVLVRSLGGLLPRLCFFASKDIQEDEELTFSYGDIRLSSKGLECFCGSSNCYGVLPSENT